MKKFAFSAVLFLLLASRAASEASAVVEPASPEEGGLVKVSFLLQGDAFRSPDELSFEFTQGLSLVEYKLAPVPGGSQVFITLRALEAGRQALIAVVSKKAGKQTRFETNVIFDVSGTVSIRGTWELPPSLYQYEPFKARLRFSREVPDSFYNLVLEELQRYYTCALLPDRVFIIVPDTALALPELSVKIPAYDTASRFSTMLTIAAASAETKRLPSGTSWIGSELPSYRLESGGGSKTGDKLSVRVSIEGAGIPLGLALVRLSVKTEAGIREVPLTFSEAGVLVADGGIVSRLAGTIDLVLDAPGVIEFSAPPILVWKTGTRTLVPLVPQVLRFVVTGKAEQQLEREKLLAIIRGPETGTWTELYKTYDAASEFLEHAKRLNLKPWSPEYAARIALALSSGDLSYARYELARAERNFMPGYIQRRYPLLYVGARTVYALPAPALVGPLFALSLLSALLLLLRGRRRRGRPGAAFFIVSAFALLLLALLVFSAAERATEYGITDKAIVRKVPDSAATVLLVCGEGTVVRILSVAGDWIYTEAGSQRGWIERRYMRYALK